MQDIQQQINAELDKFEELSSDTRNKLLEAADILKKQFAPGMSISSSINSSLTEIRKLYDNICSLIASESTEAISQELSAPELRKIAASINETAERANSDLRRFINVRSSLEKYDSCIKPVQEKAAKLLAKMESPHLSGTIKKSVMTEAGKYQKFLAMIEPEHEEDTEAVEEISHIFPSMVMFGLAKNYYYVSEPMPEPEPEIIPEPVQMSEPESEPENILPSEPEEMITARKNNKPKKSGAKSFREEVIKNAKFAGVEGMADVMLTINMLMHFGAVTLEQAFNFYTYYKASMLKLDSEREAFISDMLGEGNITEEKLLLVRNVLHWLEDHKTVAVYPHEDGKYIYCLTRWACESLAKQDIRKTFKGITAGNFMYFGDNEISKPTTLRVISNNDAILMYIRYVLIGVNQKEYTDILNSIKCRVDEIIVPVMWEGVKYKCLLMPSLNAAADYISVADSDAYVMALTTIDAEPQEVRDGLGRIDIALRERVFMLYHWMIHRCSEDISAIINDTDEDEEDEEDYTEILDIEPENDSQIQINFFDEAEPVPESPEPEHEPEELSPDTKTAIREMLTRPEPVKTETPYASLTEALLLAKAASYSPEHEDITELASQLELALPILPDTPEQNGANLSASFPDRYAGDIITEGLMLSSYIQALIFPAIPYSDYELKRRAEELNDNYDAFFPSYSEAKKLFAASYSFNMRCGMFPEGFIAGLTSSGNDGDNLSRIRAEAESLLAIPSFNKKMKILPFFEREFFGPRSELSQCLKLVSDNDTSGTERVREFTAKYYDPNKKVLEEKIRDLIDDAWAKVWREKSLVPTRHSPLVSNLRDSVVRSTQVRLEVLHRWLNAGDSGTKDYNEGEYISARSDILSAIDAALPYLRKTPGKAIMLRTAEIMRMRLNAESEPEPFAVLLTKGILPLDENNSPILGIPGIKYYEPMHNVLESIHAPRLSLKEAEAKILYDDMSPMYENLHQLKMIRGMLGENTDLGDDENRARESAEKDTEDFVLKIKTHYAFGRISEDDMETLTSLVRENEYIKTSGDFGCWRQFLEALTRHKEDIITVNRDRITREITARAEEFPEFPEELTEALAQAKIGNFSAAESCVNRFESALSMGQTVTDIHTEHKEINAFTKFMEVFPDLYRECDKPRNKEDILRRFGRNYLENNAPGEWSTLTRKLKDEQKAILDNWPSGLGNTTPEQIRGLINGLGFTVDSGDDCVMKDASRTGINNMEFYSVRIKQNDGRSCTHPIAKFGTRLEDLSVIIFYGSGTPEKTVKSIMDLDSGTSIVIMDYHVNIPSRNQFIKAFRTHGREDKYFLLIDRVLALFLTLQDTTGRLSALLQCTLPYTSSTPFTRGSGFVAPEMFYGRERELADIRNPNGSSLVYGGRQLGKTSLLKRAETLEHQPEKARYSVYCDLTENGLKKALEQRYNEPALVSWIIHSVNTKYPGLLNEYSTTFQDMCNSIEALISGKKIDTMMLLLDESDTFLDSIRDDNYEPLRPLVNLKNRTENKFRFILAGLHNVMRAKNSAADNNPLGQLGGALCIRPLSPFEAQRLLLEPLKYLGFSIDPERHLETILTATNYYPGVIQYFGYMLLEKFTERCDNSGSEELSPPFSVDDALLGSVIGSQELTDLAANTLKLSLGLDKYFMLGQCIAYLHYIGGGEDSGTFKGFTVNDIAGADSELTHCMQNEPYEAYDAILREMADMGILSRLPDGSYRFRRQTFIKTVWPDEDSVLRTGEHA